MILCDATLRQIASDAKVDTAQFIRFVRAFNLPIVQAVTACRSMEETAREIKAARRKTANRSVRARRQEAAERYANEAWRLDVR